MTETDFQYVQELAARHAGIVLVRGKEYFVESRLGSIARSAGYGTLAEFIAQLRRVPVGTPHLQAVEALCTQETSFFRDFHPFELLRQSLLPDLLRKRAATRELRIWCGAAATGQEPYSLAILLREHFLQLAGWRVQILATDLSEATLRRARVGAYTQLEANRGLSAALLVKYFDQDGTQWLIKDDVRSMVEFRPLNLIGSWPTLPSMDLVLMRNVLIYFDTATRQDILRRLRQVLRPDGYLLLGSAETTLHLDGSYELIQHERVTCYSPAQVADPLADALNRLSGLSGQ